MNGKDLKKRRLGLHLTQAELAGHLGVAANTVARWEGEKLLPPDMLSLALDGLEGKIGVSDLNLGAKIERVRHRSENSARSQRQLKAMVEKLGWKIEPASNGKSSHQKLKELMEKLGYKVEPASNGKSSHQELRELAGKLGFKN